MDIQIKELEPCKLAVSYKAAKEDVLSKRSEIISIFKKGTIPGFRAGKAPAEVVNRHYKKQIDESVKRALTEDAFHNTMFEKHIRPHGAPKFTSIFLFDNQFAAEFEVFSKPDFTVADLSTVEVVKPHVEKSVSEIAEKMMQDLRVKFGESTPFDSTHTTQVGDSVIVDYDAFLDGTKIDQICAQGEMVTLGSSALSEFDDNLIGMSLGQTKSFSMTVPDQGLPSLAGKKIDFTVTLNVGSRNEPCALDDSLAVRVGKKDFQELKDLVSASAAAQSANIEKNRLTSALAEKLVELHLFEVPEFMFLSEAKYLVSQSKLNWDKLKAEDQNSYIEMAKKNVRLSLVLDKIREEVPGAQISDQETFEVIKHNLAKTKVNTPIDDVLKEMDRTGYLQIAFSRIKDEFALDAVLKQVKVIE